jgi:predicted nucleic acid-binding protein
MLIYCDSVILIYYFDHVGVLQTRAANRLAAMHTARDQIVVSDMVRLECRVMPIRQADKTKLDSFDRFFASPDVVHVPLVTAVFDRATRIRAQHNYKTIDSINLAAAVEHGCDRFLTNDARLKGFPDITVEILP